MHLPRHNPTVTKVSSHLGSVLADASVALAVLLLGALIFTPLQMGLQPCYSDTSPCSTRAFERPSRKQMLSSIRASLPLSIGTVAFVDVNLVPMDRERVVPHQTILVEGRSISAIGPATMRVPAKALRVEGHGLLYQC
jgi:hypothetical protein